MVAAPLIAGSDNAAMSDHVRSVLTHKDVIATDPACPASKASASMRQTEGGADAAVAICVQPRTDAAVRAASRSFRPR
jgi:hypothetical protein